MSDKGRLYLCVIDTPPLGDTVATAGKVFEDIGKASAFVKGTGLPIPDDVRSVASDVEKLATGAGKALGAAKSVQGFWSANWKWIVPVSAVGIVGITWLAFRALR